MSAFRHLPGVVLALIMMVTTQVALAQSADPARDAIAAMLEAGSAEPLRFTEEFTNAVPLEEVNQVIAQVADRIGEPFTIEPHGEGYEVRGPSHKVQVRITLAGDGAISGLFFAPPVPIALSVDEGAAELLAMDGTVSLLVTRGGEDLVAENTDAPLAVGSAFKLGILAELAAQIEAGEAGWDQVLRLEERHKSLPSGDLRRFPTGAPVTVHTAASLMISQSDNTATDLLLDFVGRDAVSDRLGFLVLSTREFFQLKGNDALRAAFTAGDEAARRDVLAELAASSPPDPAAASRQHAEGVEWYMSTRQLCELVAPLAGLDVFDINAGIASFADWENVAFKGGSETGVMNLTTHLTSGAGEQFCVSFTLNRDQAIDEQAVFSAYATLLSSLKEQGGS